MIEQNVEESERRQADLQLEYVNYTVEEILQNKVNAKKRKSTTATVRRTTPVKENDAVSVSGLDESIGSYIKNKALDKYEDFSSHSIQEQTMVSLGMNSLLDLSFEFEVGLSSIFTQEQWNDLKARFPVVEPEGFDLILNLNDLTADYSITLQRLSRAKTGLEKKNKALSNWVKDQAKKTSMNEDEKIFLYVVFHIIKRHQKFGYLFDNITDCSEWDYVIKLWAPMFEELLMISMSYKLVLLFPNQRMLT